MLHRITIFLLLLGIVSSVSTGAPQARRQITDPVTPFYLPLIHTPPFQQWIGPSGGLISAVAVSPLYPNIVYAGSWGGGAYRSTDGGVTWAWRSNGLTNLTVVSLTVDPSNPGVAYAATSASGEVRMTPDGGSGWGDIGIPGVTIYTLAVPASDPGKLYAGTSNGVYLRSSGVWTALGPAGSTIPLVAVDPANANRILAGSTSGAFFSEDGGASWKGCPAVLEGSIVQYTAFNPNDPGMGYFCTTLRGCLKAQVIDGN